MEACVRGMTIKCPGNPKSRNSLSPTHISVPFYCPIFDLGIPTWQSWIVELHKVTDVELAAKKMPGSPFYKKKCPENNNTVRTWFLLGGVNYI